jgi:hypothetical protein
MDKQEELEEQVIVRHQVLLKEVMVELDQDQYFLQVMLEEVEEVAQMQLEQIIQDQQMVEMV